MEKQNNIYQNLKKNGGFVILAVPMVLALLGLTGVGVFAGFRQEKAIVQKQGNIKAEEIFKVATRLNEYYVNNKEYPKADETNGAKVLQITFGNVFPEVFKDKSVIYWSNGATYNLRYLDKSTREEIVIRP